MKQSADLTAEFFYKKSILIFSSSFSDLASRLSAYFTLLSSAEQVRAQKYKVESARQEFILSRGYLKEKLSLFLGKAPQDILIEIDAYGKPFVRHAGFALSFNLSHSKDRLVLAIAQGPAVGIDIEKINFSQDLGIAHEVFSHSEISELNQYDSQQKVRAFFKGWTQKEAFIKALGLGMSYPLKAFSVLLNPDVEGRLLSADKESAALQQEWSMQCLEIDPEYHCSVFVQARDFKIVLCA